MEGSLTDFTTALFWGFVSLGFAVGAFGTLIGAGGGFLLVPVLLLLYPRMSPASVTGVSLTVVFFNAYAGTWAYGRLGRIDYPAGLRFAAAALPGAWLGTLVVGAIPRHPFDLAFALLLLVLGLYLIVRPVRSPPKSSLPRGAAWTRERRAVVGSIGSAYLGVLSSLLGIGGGILQVPFLIRFLGLPPHVATATSLFVLAQVTCTAMVAHLVQGSLEGFLIPTACLALGVMMGAPLGAAVSGRLQGPLLVRLLALALCAVAGRLFWRIVGG
jgi:uncharacterized protein